MLSFRFWIASLFQPSKVNGTSVLVLLLALLAFSPANVAIAAGDTNGNLQWSPQKICGALQWRESRLRRCSFNFTEEEWLVKSGGKLFPLTLREFNIRRMDGRTRLQFSERNYGVPALSVQYCAQLWDGSFDVTFARIKRPGGGIALNGGTSDKAPNVFNLVSFFTVIGIQEGFNEMPWSEWLRQKLATKGVITTIEQQIRSGERHLLFHVVPGEGPKEVLDFDFLPDKDFALAHFMMRYWPVAAWMPTPKKDPGVADYKVDHVTQFDGFWMPAEL